MRGVETKGERSDRAPVQGLQGSFGGFCGCCAGEAPSYDKGGVGNAKILAESSQPCGSFF